MKNDSLYFSNNATSCKHDLTTGLVHTAIRQTLSQTCSYLKQHPKDCIGLGFMKNELNISKQIP